MSDQKVMGKILEINGNYVLDTSTMKGKIETIQLGTSADKEKYAKLVGQDVEVVLSEPIRNVIAVIGKTKPEIKCVIIMCYKPAWGLMPSIDQNVIQPLVSQFVNEGILSQVNGKKIMNALKAEQI